MPKKHSRLSAEDWLRLGLDALAESGPHALKAEPLARRIGMTKGSFYWHFSDLNDFHVRILTHWKETALAAISASRSADQTPTQKLHGVGRMLSGSDPLGQRNGLEPAIRAWANSDETAAGVMAEVDRARLAHIADLLRAIGLTNPDFPRLVYGSFLGMEALAGTMSEKDGVLSTLTAALLALQEA